METIKDNHGWMGLDEIFNDGDVSWFMVVREHAFSTEVTILSFSGCPHLSTL